jgi:hypothetical protein
MAIYFALVEICWTRRTSLHHFCAGGMMPSPSTELTDSLLEALAALASLEGSATSEEDG